MCSVPRTARKIGGATAAGRLAWEISPRSSRPAALHREGVPRNRAVYPRSRLLAVTGGALTIASLATAVAVIGLTQASHTAARVASLQADLQVLQSRVAADEHAAATQRRYLHGIAAKANGAQRSLTHVSWTLQSLPTETEVGRLRGELAAYASCIPQLQRELAGLGISWRLDPAKRSADYFKPFTANPVSGSCSALFAGR